jgi:D-beta-D-heptose 7-phosphate kinase/D-beta-D-heptose 1-phosphate adenosyltransferase
MPSLTPARAAALVARFAGRRVLVVGDVMLDHFLFGRVERISPEAPVPVVAFDHDRYRLGGAANVAHNARALGATADLVGLVGADQAADVVRAEAGKLGIGTSGLVQAGDRPTTRKVRVVTMRNQQVARVDYESDAEAPAALEALLVDPKIPHVDHYAGATLVTPNHHEAGIATSMRVRTDEEARLAARRFQQRARCESVIITRGEHGMWLLEGRWTDREVPGGAERRADVVGEASLPAVAREVADVTGAGDTVIAGVALALAAGATLAEAAELANHAAGISVGRFGPATVSPEELVSSFEG